jgi:hypothetical protein
MSEEIIKVLDYLGAQIGIAIDWSSESVWPQVMDILGRYRLFELITTGIWLVIELAMLIFTALAFKSMFKNYMTFKKSGETNFWWFNSYGSACLTGFGVVGLAAGILCTFFGLVGIPNYVEELFKWAIIPEIQYLDMLKGLMP